MISLLSVFLCIWRGVDDVKNFGVFDLHVCLFFLVLMASSFGVEGGELALVCAACELDVLDSFVGILLFLYFLLLILSTGGWWCEYVRYTMGGWMV